jgi:hypothetical protein
MLLKTTKSFLRCVILLNVFQDVVHHNIPSNVILELIESYQPTCEGQGSALPKNVEVTFECPYERAPLDRLDEGNHGMSSSVP